jgi:hypothetical protein
VHGRLLRVTGTKVSDLQPCPKAWARSCSHVLSWNCSDLCVVAFSARTAKRKAVSILHALNASTGKGSTQTCLGANCALTSSYLLASGPTRALLVCSSCAVQGIQSKATFAAEYVGTWLLSVDQPALDATPQQTSATHCWSTALASHSIAASQPVLLPSCVFRCARQ